MKVNWSMCEIVSLQLTGVEVWFAQGHVDMYQKRIKVIIVILGYRKSLRFALKTDRFACKWAPNTTYPILCNILC